jgi:hypothetical protein
MIRPQFGSPPCQLVFTRALFATARAAVRFRNQTVRLTLDGGLDGIAHAWEVFIGTKGAAYEKMKEVAELCIRLIVYGLQRIKKDRRDLEGRIALGLGTDLGGYSIMLGGTGGPHLGSFSLIDVLSHGRACARISGVQFVHRPVPDPGEARDDGGGDGLDDQ